MSTTRLTHRQIEDEDDAVEFRARNMGIKLRDDRDIVCDGRKIGWIHQGSNGEFFGCGLGSESHAFPVGSMENRAGMGERTTLGAAVAFVEHLPAKVVQDCRYCGSEVVITRDENDMVEQTNGAGQVTCDSCWEQ